jgi:hypothetical protein
MNRDQDRAVRDEIRRLAEREVFITPDLASVRRKAAHRDRSRRAGTAVGAIVLALGVAIPITLLSSLGGSSGSSDVSRPPDVLTLQCGDATASAETLVVSARIDGVHILAPEGGRYRVRFRAGGSVFGGVIRGDGSTHPWPIPPGDAQVRCNTSTPGSSVQSFRVVDPLGVWASPELACTPTEHEEVAAYDGGAVEWATEEVAIRGILPGIAGDDRVLRPLYGRDRLGRWVIVRDRRVVGVISYTPVTDASDPRGRGLGRVTGDVCRTSGIAGNVPWRDPDEDGVRLDCRAESQVAFAPQRAIKPVGDPAMLIRRFVPGIRETDVLVPPSPNGDDGTWTLEREEKTVASIVYPDLSGVTCRWNAVGT